VVRWPDLGAEVSDTGEVFQPEALDAARVVCVRGMPGGGPEPPRLDEVVFRMDVLGRLAARGTPVINRPRALEASIDKYLSLALLSSAGITVPRTRVVQGADPARAAWQSLGGDCVLKPIFGSGGRGLLRLRDPVDLADWIATLDPAKPPVVYLQEFIPHPGWDARILVVGDRYFAMRRQAAAGEWRTNLAVGGAGSPLAPPAEWVAMAFAAARAVGAALAGVDLLPRPDGSPTVVEVNAVPGWRGLERATGADVTGAVVDLLQAAAAGRASHPDCQAG